MGVDGVELTHTLGKIGIRGLNDEVIMVGHLAIGVAEPVETAAHLAQGGEPIGAVLVVAIDRLAPIAARRYVIEAAGELDAEGSGYIPKYSSKMLDYKT